MASVTSTKRFVSANQKRKRNLNRALEPAKHNGTATYYAGGGGGGGYNAVGKAGGQGGGGPGGHRYGGNGATANATANTGGGGGGAGEGGPSGAGGSGIVIIRGPNTYSATGSNYTETTDGSDKIWTFTSDGTITFSV